MTEDVQYELDALLCTYAQDIHVSNLDDLAQNDPIHIEVSIYPYTGEDASKRFVEAVLELDVPCTYPEDPPSARLRDAKGLGDVRQFQLLQMMEREAQSLAGQMLLGHLIETAKHFMTEENHPDGNCIFCLCSMDVANEDREQLKRLPCFHTFHGPCFHEWWSWQQADLMRQELELVAHTGSWSAAQSLIQEKLPPKVDGIYQTSCPVCRLPVVPADVQAIVGEPALEAAAAAFAAAAASAAEAAEAAEVAAAASRSRRSTNKTSTSNSSTSTNNTSTSQAAAGLLSKAQDLDLDLDLLRQQQRWREQVFSRQQQQGGIICEDGGGASGRGQDSIGVLHRGAGTQHEAGHGGNITQHSAVQREPLAQHSTGKGGFTAAQHSTRQNASQAGGNQQVLPTDNGVGKGQQRNGAGVNSEPGQRRQQHQQQQHRSQHQQQRKQQQPADGQQPGHQQHRQQGQRQHSQNQPQEQQQHQHKQHQCHGRSGSLDTHNRPQGRHRYATGTEPSTSVNPHTAAGTSRQQAQPHAQLHTDAAAAAATAAAAGSAPAMLARQAAAAAAAATGNSSQGHINTNSQPSASRPGSQQHAGHRSRHTGKPHGPQPDGPSPQHSVRTPPVPATQPSANSSTSHNGHTGLEQQHRQGGGSQQQPRNEQGQQQQQQQQQQRKQAPRMQEDGQHKGKQQASKGNRGAGSGRGGPSAAAGPGLEQLQLH